MWKVSQICCIGSLIGVSVIDIRSRRLPICVLALLNLLAAAWQLYRISGGKEELLPLLGGIGVGAVFFLISRVTREGIGYGDSWVILILGSYLGLWKLLEVLAGTCLLLAAASVVCLTVKKMSGRCTFPFVPFLTAGYLLSMVCAG